MAESFPGRPRLGAASASVPVASRWRKQAWDWLRGSAPGLVVLAVSLLINALRRLLAREQTYANTDLLTGLANRRAFEETARVELDRARRYSRPLSAAFIDVDDFKRINDISGHTVGDDVLHTIGVELRRGLRSSDMAARLGGDEFVLLLPESPPNAAEAALARIQKRLHDGLSDGAVHATVSIGMVTFLRPPASVQSLFASSDKVMYAAKQAKSGGLHVVLDAAYPTEPPAGAPRMRGDRGRDLRA